MEEQKDVLLTELRVVELRRELDARGVDKTGNKAVLISRLEQVGGTTRLLSIHIIQALVDNGEDPKTFMFKSDAKSVGEVGGHIYVGTEGELLLGIN